jgi:glycosyltransferase involved in cell wall biosynthesis
MITENQCGVAIPPKDTQALVDKLIALSGEPSSRIKMGQSARLLAEKEFSREKLANQFCDFIEHQSSLNT